MFQINLAFCFAAFLPVALSIVAIKTSSRSIYVGAITALFVIALVILAFGYTSAFRSVAAMASNQGFWTEEAVRAVKLAFESMSPIRILQGIFLICLYLVAFLGTPGKKTIC